MNLLAKPWPVLAGIGVFGVLTHLIPHDMGVSTVGIVSMLSAAYLPRRLLLLPVLLTVFVVDAINGFYSLLAMSFVYIAHLLAAFSISPVLKSIKPTTIFSASLVGAVVFYLVSNVTPMAMGFYPMTAEGWITCYVNGLPFLLKGIVANLIFGLVVFGAIYLVRESHAYRIAVTQRN